MSFDYESCRHFFGQLGVGCMLISFAQAIFLGGALPAAAALAVFGFVLALLGCFKPNREVNHV